jgi:tetratricopeptide (TPR) repeat protein
MRRHSNHLDYKRLRFVALSVCLLVLFQQSLFAEWYKDYEAGLELLKKGQAQAAIPRLQEAIRQKKDEGSNIKFYGMKFGDYFPHYYLGLAYFSVKNFSLALSEFEASQDYGAIQKRKDLSSKMGNMMSLARAQQITTEAPTSIASKPPAELPVIVPPVKDETKPKTEQVETPKSEEVPKTDTQPPPKEVQPLVPTKKEEVVKSPEVQKIPPSQQPTMPDPSLESAKILVRNAAKKYFEGDYDGAIGLLSGALEINANDSSAYFLLGCAYASRYLLSGSQDTDSLKKASLAFASSKKIKPGYRIRNRVYFSPAVLDLFERAG